MTDKVVQIINKREFKEELVEAILSDGYIKKDNIEVDEKEINQIIRDHFSTVFQKPDLMVAIIEAGNNASHAIASKIKELIK